MKVGGWVGGGSLRPVPLTLKHHVGLVLGISVTPHPPTNIKPNQPTTRLPQSYVIFFFPAVTQNPRLPPVYCVDAF